MALTVIFSALWSLICEPVVLLVFGLYSVVVVVRAVSSWLRPRSDKEV